MKKTVLTFVSVALLTTGTAFAAKPNSSQTAINQLQKQIQAVQINATKQTAYATKALDAKFDKQIAMLHTEIEQSQAVNNKNIATLQQQMKESNATLEKQLQGLEKQLATVNTHLQSELQQVHNTNKK
jgi:hypothetical protein